METLQKPSVSDELFAETRELEKLLAQLKRGIARDMQEDELASRGAKASRGGVLTADQRREKAKSSWARSGSKRHFPGCSSTGGSDGIDGPPSHAHGGGVERAERNLKKRAASYTISKAKRDDCFLGGGKLLTADIDFYDPRIDAVSTVKRPRSVVFTKTKRPNFGGSPAAVTDEDERGFDNKASKSDDEDDDDDGRSDSGSDSETMGNNRKVGDRRVADLGGKRTTSRETGFGSSAKWIEKKTPAFSFGRAPREVGAGDATEQGKNNNDNCQGQGQGQGDDIQGQDRGPPLYDLSRARKYLEGNVPAAIIRPPSFVPREIFEANPETDGKEDSPEAMDDNDYNQAGAKAERKTSGQRMAAFETLSTHSRAPAVSIRPASAPSAVLLNRAALFGAPHSGYTDVPSSGPGPGDYDIEAAKPGIARAATVASSKGTLYRPETKPNRAQAEVAAERAAAKTGAPGVGHYDPTRADALVLRRAAGAAGTAIMHPPAGDKSPTPQQRRKKYWEDKAVDLRQDHDGMRDANDTVLSTRQRAPTVSLHKPSALGWRSRLVLRERALQDAQAAAARAERSAGVDKALTVLESGRSNAAPLLAREAAAHASTKKRLAEKPGVLAVMHDKREAERARDKFYGPQLPVPWAMEGDGGLGTNYAGSRAASRTGSRAADKEGMDDYDDFDDDDDDDSRGGRDQSPGEQVRRLLSGNVNNSKSVIVGGGKHAESDTTSAYLRSSLAAPAARASVIMRPSVDPNRSSRAQLVRTPSPEPEFLGPQLPVDWLAAANARDQSHKNRAILFDAVPGREVVRVRQKGEVQISRFGDGLRQTDDMGPGFYDADHPLYPDVAEGAKGVVPFARLTARDEVVGPDGERPTAYEGEIADVAEEAWLRREMFDLDYGEARDAAKEKKTTRKGIVLHARERHAPAKLLLDPQDYRAAEAARAHVGGTWFKGLGAETANKAPTVDMAKMAGRSLAEADTEALMEEVAGIGVGGKAGGGELDLDVKDWNPKLPRPAPAPVFADPSKQPRFPVEKAKDGAAADHLGGSYFEGMAQVLAKKPATVNMSRPDPIDGDDGRAAARAMLDGEVDIDAALALAAERAAAVRKAEELTNPKLKRPQFFTDMNKQPQPQSQSQSTNKKQIEAEERDKDVEANPPPPEAGFGSKVKGGVGAWAKGGKPTRQEQEAEDRLVKEMLRAEGLLAPEGKTVDEEGLEQATRDKGKDKDKDKDKGKAQQSPRDPAVSSKFKASRPAVNWSKQSDAPGAVAARRANNPRGGVDVAEAPGPAMTPRGQHFVDPDPGNFKGPKPLGTKPLSRATSAAGSLADELKEEAVMREMLASELGAEVEVAPGKPPRGGSARDSGNGKDKGKDQGKGKVKEDERSEAVAAANLRAKAQADAGDDATAMMPRSSSKVTFSAGAESSSLGLGRPLAPLSPTAVPTLNAPPLSAAEPPPSRPQRAAGAVGGETSLSAAFAELDARLGEGIPAGK